MAIQPLPPDHPIDKRGIFEIQGNIVICLALVDKSEKDNDPVADVFIILLFGKYLLVDNNILAAHYACIYNI